VSSKPRSVTSLSVRPVTFLSVIYTAMTGAFARGCSSASLKTAISEQLFSRKRLHDLGPARRAPFGVRDPLVFLLYQKGRDDIEHKLAPIPPVPGGSS
jgi:hypothetical protein